MVSDKVIGRIGLYRRVLTDIKEQGGRYVFSHELAVRAGGTAAQVRRDIMSLGYSGSPAHGYDVGQLIQSIHTFLDSPAPEAAVLVGVGNLGRAILNSFTGRRPNLVIAGAFDHDPQKANRTIGGCPCFGMEELPRFVAQRGIRTGILTVPASAAQGVGDLLVRNGIRGILNFAPVPLRAPAHVYVENIDMYSALEKVAYFARQASEREASR